MNKNATSQVEGETGKSVDEAKEVKVLKHTLWDRKSEGGFPGLCSFLTAVFVLLGRY